jgi:hypothetical protein
MPCSRRKSRAAPPSPKPACAGLHAPERELPQRCQQGARQRAGGECLLGGVGRVEDRLRIEAVQVVARRAGGACRVETDLVLEHLIGIEHLVGQLVRGDVLDGGDEQRAQGIAGAGRIRQVGAGLVDPSVDGVGLAGSKRHRARCRVLVAPGQARPVQADQQRCEAGSAGADALDVGRAIEHRAGPGVVLAFRGGHVALPAVAHQEDIGDGCSRQQIGERIAEPAIGRVGVVDAFVAVPVEVDEVVTGVRRGHGLDRHMCWLPLGCGLADWAAWTIVFRAAA